MRGWKYNSTEVSGYLNILLGKADICECNKQKLVTSYHYQRGVVCGCMWGEVEFGDM